MISSDSAIRRTVETVMDKILVQWMDGRSMGRTSFVKRTAIKEGTVAVDEKVKVTWRETKKCFNAEILSVGSTPIAPVAPRRREDFNQAG